VESSGFPRIIVVHGKTVNILRDSGVRRRPVLEAGALLLLAAVLTVGGAAPRVAFEPAAVQAGQWWRLLTYPWAHVSPYHLVCDGTAFAVLWLLLDGNGLRGRWGCLAAGTAGAVLWPLGWPSDIRALGLCGLSGPAHGLMAGLCMQQARAARQQGRRADLALVAVVLAVALAKSAWESWTGSVVLASWHFGELGTPIAACHLGGVLAGLAWAALPARKPAASHRATRPRGQSPPRSVPALPA
jgi:rhomboid family GlyGly-CTERM serine protease